MVSTTSPGNGIKFGLIFFSSLAAPTDSDIYRLVIESTKFADAHGFSSVWIPERHFTRDGWLYPNPVVLLAALARETRQIRLHAGSVVLPLHHPIRVAEDWAMLDHLSGGRVGISFASGWHPNDFVFFPDHYATRNDVMYQGIQVVQKLWRGESIQVQGGDGKLVDIRTYPTPLQRELPFWITAAGNPKTFAGAGEIGANLLTHMYNQSVEELAEKIRIYREARERQGYDPQTGQVSVMLHTFVSDTTTALQQALDAFAEYLKSASYLLNSIAYSRGQKVDIASLSEEDVRDYLHFVVDRLVSTRRILFGTPESCFELVQQLKAVGVNEIACQLDFGLTTDVILQSMPYLNQLKERCDGGPAAQRPAAWEVLSSGAGREAAHANGDMPVAEYGSSTASSASSPDLPVSDRLPDIRRRCQEEVSVSAFYEKLRNRGIQLEGSFQGIEHLWRCDGEALGQVRLREAVAQEADAYQIHPTLLDACFQVLIATLPDRLIAGDDALYVPTGLRQFQLYRRPGRQVWSHASLQPADQDAESLEGDVRILDEQGELLLEACGLQLRRLALTEHRPAPAHAAELENTLYELHWEAVTPAKASRPAQQGSWVIFMDSAGVGRRLGELLAACGEQYIQVFPGESYRQVAPGQYQLSPASTGDMRRLLRDAVAATGLPCRGLIHLWSLNATPLAATTVTSLQNDQALGCEHALLLMQELSTLEGRELPRLWLVTQGAQPVEATPSLALSQSPLWGLGRSCAIEHPELWGGLIDIDPQGSADLAAGQLLAVLLSERGEDQIAFRQERTYVARLARSQQWSPQELTFRPDASYLITGGLWGLGLEVARWMIGKGARHLVLIGRSKLPPRATWDLVETDSRLAAQIAAIRRLEQLGADVSYVPVSVADGEQLAALLREFSSGQRPPLKGVIHAASVWQDAQGQSLVRSLSNLNAAALSEVFQPKVIGAWLLYTLLKETALDFFVSFSSGASLFGSAAQGNYAAASAFLDALAHQMRAEGRAALSIDWGAVSEVGFGATQEGERIHEYWEAHGIERISPRQVLAALELLIPRQVAQVGVLKLSWPRLQQFYPQITRWPLVSYLLEKPADKQEEAGTTLPPAGSILERLHAAPENRRQVLETYLCEQVAGVLRIPPSRLNVNEPLTALGMDSLMAIELKNKVEYEAGVRIPIVSLLQGPSIAQFAGQLLDQIPLPAASTGEREVQADQNYFPLSHNQKALWFLSRLAPTSAAYNLLYAAVLRSRLNLPALRGSLQTLLQRHPILTATYTVLEGEPVQSFHPDQRVDLEEIDASSWSREELQEQLYAEGNRPIDLEHGPLLRLKLFRRSEQEHILSLTIHHIAVDFWALDLLVEELLTLYLADSTGMALPSLPERPPFSEFVRWQNEMLAGPEGERLWAYWQRRLSGDLPLLNLPTDRPRPPVQTYRGASHRFTLDESLARRLRALARAANVTLYTVLLAAFQLLLARYSNQEDVLVGTPALGRNRAELEQVIGYLANPVVLRTSFSGNPTFRELLGRVQETVVGALEHQDFPFPLIVERLQPRRDPAYSPIFQTLFIWDKLRARDQQEHFLAGGGSSQPGSQGLMLEPVVFGQQGAPFDLTLTIFEAPDTLSADFRYNIDLFDAATLSRMESHFQTLLTGIVSDPDQPVQALPLLTEAERHQIMVEWNATQSDYPEHACIHQLFEAQAQRTPEAPAIIFEEEQLSYRELNRRANHLARTLQASGVGPDVLVGVCMERSIEMVVALLAILKAGGAYVPLEPAYPAERLAYMVQDAHISILLTQTAVKARLSLSGVQTICLDKHWNPSDEEGEPLSLARPDNLIYVIYTSGSTGTPKGVPNTHRGVCNRLFWMQQTYRLTAEDRVLQKTPFSFDVSAWEFFWPLMTGACLVVARPGGHQDPAYLASLIARQQITTLHFVPSMLQAFLMEPNLEQCTSLKNVFCSGEALSFDLQQRFFSRFSCRLHNLYGPTEAAIDVTYWECQRESQQPVVPIGRPIANTQIYILNSSMQPVPVGVAGELYIGGVGVARGYLNRPELTAEKFIPDPFSAEPGRKLFKTGDLARYRRDGAIEFLGRIDHQVKIRGFRIELGEIEAVLLQHPAIEQAVVVAREDTPGNKRLIAYLVSAQQETTPSTESLRGYLKDRLPDYMIPSLFLFLEALPLSANGKVDRKALPEPSHARPELEKVYVAPRSETEEQLARIWAEVLGLDRVGINDNFFDLGGASIQCIEVVSKSSQAGLPVTLDALFEHQTIAELAFALERAQSSEEPEKPVERVSGGSVSQVAVSPAREERARGERGNTVIESLGVYLPPRAVSTDEIVQQCHKPIRFPLARLTGINSRRMAGETEFSFDLAKQAVEQCLKNSRYTPADIDLLICTSISRCDGPNALFSFEPSTSLRLRHHFGFSNAIAFDISNACTGLFTGIYIADAFLKTGLIRRGLVVSGEYITHLTLTAQKELEGYMDSRLACLTVGDAGAALILESAPDKRVGFHEFEMYTLGRYSEYCIAKATDREHGGAIMYTDAVNVTAVNLSQAVSHAGYIIERSQWPTDSIQHIIVHQTSKTTLRDVAREINAYFGKEICSPESVIDNIAERGNTATTTHAVAMMDHIRSDRIKSGENVIFGITGSGATIGTAIYTFDDLPDRLRRSESGVYIPDRNVSEQQELAPLFPPGWRVRVESTGVVPPDSQTEKKTLPLIKTAAENCFAASSYRPADIDLLIYAGTYRDDFLCEPAIASLVAGQLGINDTIQSQTEKKTFAFDVFNGSLAPLDACYAAIGMMRAGKAKNALIVASEVENNRDVLPEELLGIEETGSALLLDESPDGATGFGNFVFESFTDYSDARVTHTKLLHNGKMVLHAVKDPQFETALLQCIQQAVHKLLSIEHVDMSQIAVLLPPQSSPAFVDALSAALGIDRDRCIDVHAAKDLFTSSLAYTLQAAQRCQKVKKGDIGLIISVASGIQVGCTLYYF